MSTPADPSLPPGTPSPRALPPEDADLPWEALDALAAGELAPSTAERLRARIASEPRLREASEAAERTEAALRAQPLLDLPPGLAERVVAGLPRHGSQYGGRGVSLPAVARLAAAVLLVLGAWVATSGSVPTLAAAATPPQVTHALTPVLGAVPAPDLAAFRALPGAAAREGISAPVLALAGVVLLAAGLVVARLVGGRAMDRWNNALLPEVTP